MKLLLLQPPIEDFYETEIRLQPLGLAYIKAAVCRNLPDVEVRVKDLHRGFGRRTLPWPAELKYLEPYYGRKDESPFSTFHNYFRFGAGEEQIRALLREERPDAVGISSLFTPYAREALRVAELVKEELAVPVLMGGSHVSACPETILKNPYVDFVIRGEGEKPVVEWLKAMQGLQPFTSVPGLGYKPNGVIKFNLEQPGYPIDELAFPALDDLPADNYLYQRKRMTFMITSRSCPHKCSFCSVHTTFGHDYRRRSLENILAEIRQRYEEGVRAIDFEDDNLTFFKPQMKELCRRIIRDFPARDLQLVAMNGISYLSLDEELLELMFEAGFTNLNLALVSSDKSVLESTKRPHTVDIYTRVVKMAFKLGFEITSYQILGLPNETLASMVQTLAFNASQPVLLGASPFYLTPASPIARQLGWTFSEKDLFLSRLSAMAYPHSEATRDDLYTLFVATRILNFLKDPVSWSSDSKRVELGWEILARLWSDRRFYGFDSRGFYEQPRFNVSLWENLTSKTAYVCRQDGVRMPIALRSPYRSEQNSFYHQSLQP